MWWACPATTSACLQQRSKKKEDAAEAAPSDASGSDALVTQAKGVVRHVGLAHAGEQVRLDARTFADDGMDRLQVQHLLIAQEACALAQRPVEREADGLDPARCGPGVGDLVAALVLGGGGEDHVGDPGVGFVQSLPEKFVVLPIGSAREDYHRSGRRVVFAALGGAGGKEVARINLAGGKAG
jgi:hypothetical protein